jgi:hypothetical protein
MYVNNAYVTPYLLRRNSLSNRLVLTMVSRALVAYAFYKVYFFLRIGSLHIFSILFPRIISARGI